MLSKKIIQRLRCPLTRSPLNLAAEPLVEAVNVAISRSQARDRSGQPVTNSIQGGLQCGCWLYPIRDGIPAMIADEAIDLSNLDISNLP